MIIYAACYTDCYHEYAPAIFSLHETLVGAECAISKSKKKSLEEWHEAQKQYGYPVSREWNYHEGYGMEKWLIKEVEVQK